MNFRDNNKMISCYFSKINVLYRKYAKESGLTYNTMLVMYILKLKSPCTQKNISDEWELPKQTVNTIIKDLEKKNLISFSFNINNKEKTITLTDEGKKVISNSIEKIQKLEESFYEKIGEENTEFVLSILENYFSMLEKEFLKKSK